MYLCRIQGMSKIHSSTPRGVPPPPTAVNKHVYLRADSWPLCLGDVANFILDEEL
jgi:hypothetical protein